MKTDSMLVAIAGALALQVAAAQSPLPSVPGVSLRVAGTSGAVGSMCEMFDCTPHHLAVDSGEYVLVEMFGMADQPYILFAGEPTTACIAFDWALGGLVSLPPWIVVDIGLVPASGLPGKCGMDTATMKLGVPDPTPAGAALTLQVAAWPLAFDMPAFSRGVTLVVK